MPSSPPLSLSLIALTTVLAVSSLLFAGRSNYRQLLAADSSKSNLRVSVPEKANSKYLYYHSYSHDWSNQLIGLAHAAQIAHETNRILILPPIIEHYDRVVADKEESSGCQHCLMTQVYKDAMSDAEKCAPDEHVSFKEVIDLSQLSKSTGVQFVDLCDFVATEPTLSAENFFQQKQRQSHPEIIDLDGECTFGQTRSYPEMVDHFNSIFGDDDVALIPSAFATKNLNSQSEAFLDNVLSFHPSSALMELQQLCKQFIDDQSVVWDPLLEMNIHESHTFTLSDLLVKEDASQMLASMKVSADIVTRILDQQLVSLGNNVVTSKSPKSPEPEQVLAYVS